MEGWGRAVPSVLRKRRLMLALLAFVVTGTILPAIAIPVAFGVLALSVFGWPRGVDIHSIQSMGRSFWKLVDSTFVAVGAILVHLILGRP